MTYEPPRRPGDTPGLVRFEVAGLPADRDLLRALARRLAQDDVESRRLRDAIAHGIPYETAKPLSGREIYAALRSSPMVGANLDLTREVVPERNVEL